MKPAGGLHEPVALGSRASSARRGRYSVGVSVGVAFIRGINVGGKNPLPMATLRAICEGAGLREVRTYIQSGNVVFSAPGRAMGRAAKAIEEGIEREAGFRPSVVVRTLPELRAVVEVVPFEAEPAKLVAMFLAGTPGAGARRAVEEMAADPERLELIGREVFIHFPNGIGRAKLQIAKVEKAVGLPGTCRNWNTVLKMVELAGGVG